MEQALIIGIVLVAIFMVMVFTNVPISVALGGSTIVTMLLFGVSIDSYADLMVSGMRKFSYLAIPFFILSGILMDRSGVAARIIRFAKACIGHIRRSCDHVHRRVRVLGRHLRRRPRHGRRSGRRSDPLYG